MIHESLAARVGTVTIAQKPVARLGLGTMRLTGRGIWGEPNDRDECVAVVRRAIELGVQFVDTADSYGPHVAEEIIREAIHPYPSDVVIATKVGLTRNGPDVIDTPNGPERLGPKAWPPVGRSEYLRQQTLMCLRRLGVDQIDLLQLHRVDPDIGFADQVGELAAMRDEGLVADIGLSQVTTDQIDEARRIVPIVSVQNRFNLAEPADRSVLEYCSQAGIAFIPWAPVGQGSLVSEGTPLDEVSSHHGATAAQVALAWLLASDPCVVPIPGTSQRAHLEENVAAADLKLTADEMHSLTNAFT